MEHPAGDTHAHGAAGRGRKGPKTPKDAEERIAELKLKAEKAKKKIDAGLEAAEGTVKTLVSKHKERARIREDARVAKEAVRPGGRTPSVYDVDLKHAHEHIGAAIREAKAKHDDLGIAIDQGHSAKDLVEKSKNLQASFDTKLKEARRTIKAGDKKKAAVEAAVEAATKETPALVREGTGRERSPRDRADRSAYKSSSRAKSRPRGSSRGDDFLTD